MPEKEKRKKTLFLVLLSVLTYEKEKLGFFFNEVDSTKRLWDASTEVS